MIRILHLYYDLLNLYGENANTRCLVHSLELNKIKTQVDLKSINDKIDFFSNFYIHILYNFVELIQHKHSLYYI